jgi:hypothetical protein
MTMLIDELAEIRQARPLQIFKLQKLLEERDVPEHLSHILRERIATGDLSLSEARCAIDLIERKWK